MYRGRDGVNEAGRLCLADNARFSSWSASGKLLLAGCCVAKTLPSCVGCEYSKCEIMYDFL